MKVLKETGPGLSTKNLLITWIWTPWVAPPISQGTQCFPSSLHTDLGSTFCVN